MRNLTRDYRQATEAELRETLVEIGRRQIRAWSRNRRDYLKLVRFWVESELAYRVLAARPQECAPTAAQQRFMLLLRDGTRSSDDLHGTVNFHDPDFDAAFRDAQARGWVEWSLGGIGGLFEKPPSWFEITPLGRQALSTDR